MYRASTSKNLQDAHPQIADPNGYSRRAGGATCVKDFAAIAAAAVTATGAATGSGVCGYRVQV